mmetsp:Transcript_8462/g.16035  ORF Transcript_8462/g.16035 Transcript_8462/m.16035 type:complete len:398 (-) Transcript_8462:282-1475(-)
MLLASAGGATTGLASACPGYLAKETVYLASASDGVAWPRRPPSRARRTRLSSPGSQQHAQQQQSLSTAAAAVAEEIPENLRDRRASSPPITASNWRLSRSAASGWNTSRSSLSSSASSIRWVLLRSVCRNSVNSVRPMHPSSSLSSAAMKLFTSSSVSASPRPRMASWNSEQSILKSPSLSKNLNAFSKKLTTLLTSSSSCFRRQYMCTNSVKDTTPSPSMSNSLTRSRHRTSRGLRPASRSTQSNLSFKSSPESAYWANFLRRKSCMRASMVLRNSAGTRSSGLLGALTALLLLRPRANRPARPPSMVRNTKTQGKQNSRARALEASPPLAWWSATDSCAACAALQRRTPLAVQEEASYRRRHKLPPRPNHGSGAPTCVLPCITYPSFLTHCALVL